MALIQKILILGVVCILAGALTQTAAEPHNNRQHDHDHDHNHEHEHHHDHEHHNREDKEPTWVTCDFSIIPKMRCQDCHTRLICKRIGGLLLDCPSPWAPYCNNGLCSPVPSVECA